MTAWICYVGWLLFSLACVTIGFLALDLREAHRQILELEETVSYFRQQRRAQGVKFRKATTSP